MDITTVEIEDNGTMKQIFTSGGGHWGGMKVEVMLLTLHEPPIDKTNNMT